LVGIRNRHALISLTGPSTGYATSDASFSPLKGGARFNNPHEKISFVIKRVNSSSLLLSFLVFALFVAAPCLFAQDPKEAEAGALLFRDKGCTFCHGVGGIGTKKGPALTELPTDKTWTPEKIADRILNGGQKMPPFRDSVTDDEVRNLVVYLRTKDKPAPQPASTDAQAASTPASSQP
jgi:mono/diheme cytochrome c family protein